jgi:hypothetical protein
MKGKENPGGGRRFEESEEEPTPTGTEASIFPTIRETVAGV